MSTVMPNQGFRVEIQVCQTLNLANQRLTFVKTTYGRSPERVSVAPHY
jgi:hypothetical protein